MASKTHLQPHVPIHFFKVITDHSLHEVKLMIPNAFVKKYGEELPSTIFLKPPNGTEWKLNLEKCDGKVWFQKGWKEFVEHHSLAFGHFLVFRHERTSHFQVQIFDMSTEIDYPTEGKMASNDQGNKSPNNQNLKHHRSGQKRKDNPSMGNLQPCNLRNRKFDEVENISKLPKKEARHNTDTKCNEKAVINAKHLTALDRASSFKPRNPSFLVVMQPSYINLYCTRLCLPSQFCQKHFDPDKEQGDIDLQMLNLGIWPTMYRKRITSSRKKFELLTGWKAFAKDNNLQVGDVCTFELIPRTKLTFQVHIFRKTHNSNCSSSQGKI